MKKAIVVGDLHGRLELAQLALRFTDYNVIFVGDYLDSFDRTRAEQIGTAQLVIDAMNEDPDRVFALRGNHELNYEGDPAMRCSGYSRNMHDKVRQNLNLSGLYDYLWVDDYLISHAGVSQRLLDRADITLEQYLEAGDFKQIGHSRGGTYMYGGLYWCDWWDEFDPIEDTPQIVGHSNYRPRGEPRGIVTKGNSYNIDCLERKNEVLLLEQGETPKILELGRG